MPRWSGKTRKPGPSRAGHEKTQPRRLRRERSLGASCRAAHLPGRTMATCNTCIASSRSRRAQAHGELLLSRLRIFKRPSVSGPRPSARGTISSKQRGPLLREGYQKDEDPSTRALRILIVLRWCSVSSWGMRPRQLDLAQAAQNSANVTSSLSHPHRMRADMYAHDISRRKAVDRSRSSDSTIMMAPGSARRLGSRGATASRRRSDRPCRPEACGAPGRPRAPSALRATHSALLFVIALFIAHHLPLFSYAAEAPLDERPHLDLRQISYHLSSGLAAPHGVDLRRLPRQLAVELELHRHVRHGSHHPFLSRPVRPEGRPYHITHCPRPPPLRCDIMNAVLPRIGPATFGAYPTKGR